MRGFSSDLPDYWYAHHAVNWVQPSRAAPLALAVGSLKSLRSIYIQEVAFRLLIPTLLLKIVNFTATFRMCMLLRIFRELQIAPESRALGVATLTDLQITLSCAWFLHVLPPVFPGYITIH